MTKPHALIAGAGIGGLTAALCLARIGWRVSLLERAPLLEEVGAGLQLSPNASRILNDLGVLARLEGASLAPRANSASGAAAMPRLSRSCRSTRPSSQHGGRHIASPCAPICNAP